MNVIEIEEQKWKIGENIKITSNRSNSLDMYEQECHINVLRAGYTNPKEQEILIDCSNQMMITELKNSEYFTLTHVLISKDAGNDGFILSIKGILLNNGLTIRKKIPIVTEEERKIRSDRAKKNFKK